MEKLLYTIPQVCELTALSRSTVYELVRTGELPKIKIGKAIRITDDGLRAWLKRCAAEIASAPNASR
jgi:excisionase family DNA binding protein